MEMVRLARTNDFIDRTSRTYRVLGRPVGIFREADGSFRAMEMACKHQGADLTGGRMRGDEITCPWHGWRYNLRTGACTWGGVASLRPYACEVRGEDIYVSLRPLSESEMRERDRLDHQAEEDQIDFN